MKRRLILSLAAALVLGGCSDQQEPNTSSNAGPELAATSATVQLNVVLKTAATAAQRTELSKYGTIYDELLQLNAVFMRATKDQIPLIAALPFVESVGTDAERDIGPIDLIPPGTTDFAGTNNVWNLDAVNVTDKLSAGRKVPEDGSDVYVAVLDTGLLPSWQAYFPAARIATQYAKSFGGGAGPTEDNVSEQPDKWEKDTYSHGTHVTSIIIGYQYQAASTGGFFLVDGVAPKATIIPVKVLNQSGRGWSSAIAQGIVYVADLAGTDGLLDNKRVVINMSLGGSQLDPVEKKAMDYAVARNVVIVASAGNSGPTGAMGYPGAYAPVISVAAAGWVGEWDDPAHPTVNCTSLSNGVDALTPSRFWRQCDVQDPYREENFYITDFSALRKAGQDLDVAAPGSWVVGPWQEQQGTTSYFFVGGTSQSSPHVAGIVALMLQKNRNLPAADVEGLLEGAALDLDDVNQKVRPDIGLTATTPPDWTADRSGSGFITADAALAAVGSSVARRR